LAMNLQQKDYFGDVESSLTSYPVVSKS